MANSDWQAGAEIEITPEMIEAGVREYRQVDLRFESPEDAVCSIFMAMIGVAGNILSTNRMTVTSAGALVSVMACSPHGDGIVYVSDDGGITFQARGSQ